MGPTLQYDDDDDVEMTPFSSGLILSRPASPPASLFLPSVHHRVPIIFSYTNSPSICNLSADHFMKCSFIAIIAAISRILRMSRYEQIHYAYWSVLSKQRIKRRRFDSHTMSGKVKCTITRSHIIISNVITYYFAIVRSSGTHLPLYQAVIITARWRQLLGSRGAIIQYIFVMAVVG